MTRVVTLRSDDAGACVALEIAAFDPPDRFPAHVWRRLIGPRQDAGSVIALGIRGPRQSLAGAILVLLRSNSRVARIYSVAVDPAQRRRGLGSQLISSVIHRMPKRCTSLVLEARPDNTSARALYARLGFVCTGTRPDYYVDGSAGLTYVRDCRV